MGVARTVVVLSAAAAAVVLTACGDNAGPGSAATAAPGADAGAQPAQTGPAEPANFGPGCGGVPASGPGSFEGMAGEPVATAA
ncbi:MAG TPA: fasciclin domain-containing protein, partial [Pseudonocardia sp.]